MKARSLSSSTLGALLSLVLLTPVFAAEAKRPFNLAAGDAAQTLPRFAEQAEREIVFSPAAVRGVQTNALSGSYPPREALDLLVANTKLVVTVDAASGAFSVRVDASPPNGPKTAPNLPPATPSTSPDMQEKAIELSPFVVQVETGWNATETLAGTRMKTDLKDVPNQLEMFTSEFMQDLALNNVDDIVIYSLNADSLDEYMQDNNAENGATNLSKKIRVRGLAEVTGTRGFFASRFQADAYNTDTMTVASGSNPTLFGLGNSAGTIDASVGRAGLRNRAGVKLQYSSEDSRRASIDLNRVIVPDKVALRFDGLWSEMHTFRKPDHDKQERYTFGVLVKPFASTTVHASYEHIVRDGNIAPRNLAQDRVSLWTLAPTVPGSPYREPRPGYDNRTAIPANLSNTTRIFGPQAAGSPVFISDGSPVPPMDWGRSVTVLNPTAATAFGVPNAAFDRAVSLERTFMDGTYFPIEANIAGNLRTTTQAGYIGTVYLEQKLRRNLFVEVSYNKEKWTQNKLLNIAQVKVFVDPNLYLPVSLPGETAPRPNPNFGLMYLDNGSPNGFWEQEIDETLRASLSYSLNAAQEVKTTWGRWLGLHRFVGTWERAVSHVVRLSGGMRPRILDDPFLPGIALTPRTTRNWAINASRRPSVRAYISSRGADVSGPGGQGRGWTYLDGNGNPAKTTYYDSGLVSATSGKRLGTNDSAATGTGRLLDSGIFAWQGGFLPDREGRNRLLFTYGVRRDSIRTSNSDADSVTRDFSGLFPLPEDTTWEPWGGADIVTNRSRGVVLHPWRWISLFATRSTTFAPVGREFYDPYGNAYPGSGGESQDYGIRFDLWKDRISLRYNRFEAAGGPTPVPTGRLRNLPTDAGLIERRVLLLDPGLPQINVTDGTQRGFPGNAPTYMVMSFREATGHEVSLNVRPTPNWNIRINATKGDSVDSNIGTEWRTWIAERLPVWERVVAKNGEVDASGRPVTWNTALLDPSVAEVTLKQYFENTLMGDTIAFMNAAEGRRTDGARGKRANAIMNYRFSEGRLKGLSVTGAVRWRPPPTIGYPVMVLPSGTATFDVDHPYRGKSETWTDAGVSYRGRIARFNGLRYTAQLNVRNVFDIGPTIPFRSYTDGTIASLATLEPRLFTFTWALEF